MISKYNKYLQELHNRNYSIYDDSETEMSALQELHDQSYLIFDNEETLNLMIEYEEEFDRLSHKVSFVSLQNMANQTDIFQYKTKPIIKENKKIRETKDSYIQLLLGGILQKKMIEKGKDEIDPSIKSVNSNISKKKVVEKPIVKKPLMNPLVGYASETHLFFIRRVFDVDGICDAIGHFDPISKSFVLHKDSVLSLDVDSELRYSALDIQRYFFTNKHCIKKSNGFKLLHDFVCSSPSQAAFYVLGYNVDGWEEWLDDEGKTISELYK